MQERGGPHSRVHIVAFLIGGATLTALAAAGLFVLIVPRPSPPPGSPSSADAREIQETAQLIETAIAAADAGCPSVGDLVASDWLEDDSQRDPYDMPYRVDCSGSSPRAYSAGPDRRFGTSDDWPPASPP